MCFAPHRWFSSLQGGNKSGKESAEIGEEEGQTGLRKKKLLVRTEISGKLWLGRQAEVPGVMNDMRCLLFVAQQHKHAW
jgi:hypothetical protein